MAKLYSGKISVKIAYDNLLAHKIEAGADMFLMPSRYEPCGLNQIYSLRYGTVPIVRATGGLDDTIEAFNPETGGGTGFKFQGYDGAALLKASPVRRSLHIATRQRGGGSRPRAWPRIFSWQASAIEYARLLRGGVEIQKPKGRSYIKSDWGKLIGLRQFTSKAKGFSWQTRSTALRDSTFQAEGNRREQ